MSSNKDGKKIIGMHIGKSKVILKFLDGKMDITPNTYTEFRLFVGKLLKDEDIKELTKYNELDKYLTYAKKLVLASSRSETNVRDKLKEQGAKPRQIEQIIKELKRYALIDDSSLIKDLLEQAEYKHYGKNKTITFLKSKGIKDEDIKKIKFNDKDELKSVKELIPSLEKKFAKYNYQSKKEHIYNSLLRLGYDYDIASEVISYVKPNDYKDELAILRKEYQKIYARYAKKLEGYELDSKVVEYLLSKGYRYKDIELIKGEKRK